MGCVLRRDLTRKSRVLATAVFTGIVYCGFVVLRLASTSASIGGDPTRWQSAHRHQTKGSAYEFHDDFAPDGQDQYTDNDEWRRLTGDDLGYSLEEEEEEEAVDEGLLAYLTVDQLRELDVQQKHSHYLSVRFSGRLGNQMFAYASLQGIALHNGMKPCVTKGNILADVFRITAEICPNSPKSKWGVKLHERRPAAYDSRTERLNYQYDIELVGYFQSWKYFSEQRATIAREFTLIPEPLDTAKAFIQNATRSLRSKGLPVRNQTIVGIHVRRGDMLMSYNVFRGYTVASLDYIHSSMAYFLNLYKTGGVLFLVCSDAMEWCEANIPRSVGMGHVVFSPFQMDYEDLALLSLCNHVIMTVGTFGWWGAWLAGGETVYYRNYPKPFSQLSNGLQKEDHFPPQWVGLE